jgi:hypothetical protein
MIAGMTARQFEIFIELAATEFAEELKDSEEIKAFVSEHRSDRIHVGGGDSGSGSELVEKG